MKQSTFLSEIQPSHRLAIPITLLVVLLSTRFGGYFSVPPSNISAFWPANALLFSAVFLLPSRQGRVALLLALPTYAGAELWIGYPLRNAIVYGFANVTEVTVLLWLFRQTGTRFLAFDRLKDLFLLLSLALLASPVGGAIGALEATQAGGVFGSVFLRWSLADFFGYCLCVPLVLTWWQWRQSFAFESPARIAESAVLLMVLVLVSVVASGIHFLGLSAPLGAQFLSMPLLLWAALRFGPPGGAIATVIVASIAFFSATHGVGLFAAGAPEENVASLQLFFASLVISVMTIASLNAERKQSFDALQQEVAERKQAEQALKKSEGLLNTTQRLTKVGGWEFDVKSGKSFWTEELYRIHEIPNDPGIDHLKESLACYAPEDRQIINNAFQRACEQSESYDLEFPFTTYTGKPLWIRTTAQPVYEEGKVVRLVGNLMDITERKRAEVALRESEARLRTLVQTIPDLVWLKDPQGAYLSCNPTFERFFGAREADIVGKTDYDFVERELADSFRANDMAAAASGGPRINEEWVTFADDGHRALLQTTKTPMLAPDGQLIGVLGVARDITELRALTTTLERRVYERTAELETALYDLENFNYSASHDLRIPLRAVDGFSQILLEEHAQQLDAEGMRLLHVVRDNTKRMAQFLDDMQAFSRTGRQPMAHAAIDTEALVHEVMQELRPASGRDIKVEIDSLPTVYADRTMLRQVFVNLLSNAIKFSRPGEVPEIKVGCSIKGDEFVFFVKDNGVGFDMQFADKLFGVFQRLHGVGEFEGTGIGLVIVKRIVTRHGGRVWAEGKVGEGATFYFSLPQSSTNETTGENR